MESDEREKLLNVRETAELLGVHENTIRNWVRQGVIVTSRVPGSRSHRFSRAEVQRLQRERGKQTSSVSNGLKLEGPELANAMTLAAWASTDDAKGAFPELMRRLLASTPGVSGIRLRAHEGVSAPGWDGQAESTGSAYLPAGALRFEFGTSAAIKAKAMSDYDKRVAALPQDKDAVFVFATPRNWPNASAWAAEKAAEGKFSGVTALDAHDLEGWLQNTPAVHIWISERLGLRPRSARTISDWWGQFSAQTDPVLPAGFHLAGRSAEADEFWARLLSEESVSQPIAVKARWRDEALAFVFAALASAGELEQQAVVVEDADAWSRLTGSRTPLILIPLIKDGLDLRAAAGGGHRVVFVVGDDDLVRGNAIELKKIHPSVAAEELRAAGLDWERANRLVAHARRSMPAMFRSIARDRRFARPEWADDETRAAVLAPLILAGTWTECDGDRAAIAQLTSVTTDAVERLLSTLSHGVDAPFTQSGGRWRPTSPEEAMDLLAPALTAGDLSRWEDVIADVLLEPDPFSGMDDAARFTASFNGIHPKYSETLRGGFSSGLVLAASHADAAGLRPLAAAVRRIAAKLLEAANDDLSGATWSRLSSVLPDIAEAAPEIFLDALRLDLDRDAAALGEVLSVQEQGIIGPRSRRHYLTWALERIAASPSYFGASIEAIARLAALDHDFDRRNGDRPVASLEKLMLGWQIQSGASTEDKLAALERLLARHRDVGWELLSGLWPSRHAFTTAPASPRYRDWGSEPRGATYAEWAGFVGGLVELGVTAAGTDSKRWAELIGKVDELGTRHRTSILDALRAAAEVARWKDEQKLPVWKAVVGEIERHEKYADADWAMPASDVAALRAVAQQLRPTGDPRRYSSLFTWRAFVATRNDDSPALQAEAVRQRQAALADVLGSGSAALEDLTKESDTPALIGELLADREDAPVGTLLRWIPSAEPKLRQAAVAYANQQIRRKGFDWITRNLTAPEMTAESSRQALMAAVPAAREFWERVPDLGPQLEAAYWNHASAYAVPEDQRSDAVALFLRHNRPWEALTTASLMLNHDGPSRIDGDTAKAVLRAAAAGNEPIADVTMIGYYAQQLLEYLDSSAPDDPDLPALEFLFFGLLHEHRPSNALYRDLCRDPTTFAEMIKHMFRAPSEPKRDLPPSDLAFVSRSFDVMREWRLLPGLRDDGSIDEDHLRGWVRSARLMLAEADRSEVGDEQIGEILATSPPGTDGQWPAEPVREVIEEIGSTRIDTGVHIGKRNQRGVTSRSIFEGGAQERELETQYRAMAAQLSTRWPRTARILRGLADDYRLEAEREDAEAERWGDND